MKLATRQLFIAGLLAAAGLAATAQTAPVAPAQGPQTMPAHEGRGRMDPAKMQERMQERMAKRMAMLKQKLNITLAQEGAWNTFTAALKPTLMQRPSRAEFDKLSTPERIDRMRAMRTARTAEADKRGEATKTFYTALSAEQKKAFDEISSRFMRDGKGRHGRHHGGHHRT
jgi:protein CpxP